MGAEPATFLHFSKPCMKCANKFGVPPAFNESAANVSCGPAIQALKQFPGASNSSSYIPKPQGNMWINFGNQDAYCIPKSMSTEPPAVSGTMLP